MLQTSFAAKYAAQDDNRIRPGVLEAIFHNRIINHTDPTKRNGEE
jgi:hypothetical protein